ncbi:hypothetical protein BJX70DRAFT_403900 [Aspergillus crustosus]
MASKPVALLVACFFVLASYANANDEGFDVAQEAIDLEDILNYHIANGARALEAANIFPRAEVATVTVTETVCGSDGPTSAGDSSIISIPETTLVTESYPASPIPITAQPPVSSGTGSSPSVEPTSVFAPSISPEGQATATQNSSFSSVDGTQASTETSETPTSTARPPLNAGVTQKASLVLALALAFVQVFGV